MSVKHISYSIIHSYTNIDWRRAHQEELILVDVLAGPLHALTWPPMHVSLLSQGMIPSWSFNSKTKWITTIARHMWIQKEMQSLQGRAETKTLLKMTNWSPVNLFEKMFALLRVQYGCARYSNIWYFKLCLIYTSLLRNQ